MKQSLSTALNKESVTQSTSTNQPANKGITMPIRTLANNLTRRVAQSPLLQYVNFKDGSHVNLIKILKPYADGRAYYVHETTKSIFCSSGYFMTYEKAMEKFNLMVANGALESEILNQGITGN
jgi:hypothetical protein